MERNKQKKSIEQTKNAPFHARSGEGPLALIELRTFYLRFVRANLECIEVVFFMKDRLSIGSIFDN